MNKVAVLTNFNVQKKAKLAFEAASRIKYNGGTPLFPIYVSTVPALKSKAEQTGCEFMSIDELYSKADTICTVGGDGSIIEAAKRSSVYGIPVLGINGGRVGYTAELEPNEINLIDKFMQGEYRTEKRFMLKAQVMRNDKVVAEGIALNEIVLTNGSTLHILDFDIREAGVTIGRYRADGMVVSTPTGSTAYGLSCGGPILDPRLCCYCLIPMNAHSLAAKPVVVPGDAEISLVPTSERNPQMLMYADGKMISTVLNTDSIKIVKYEFEAGFIRHKPAKNYLDLIDKLK